MRAAAARPVALALSLAAIAALAAAASAPAASVAIQESGASLAWTSGAGEVNQLAMNLQGDEYTLQDLVGPTLTTTPPCSVWLSPTLAGAGARCPAFGIERATVALGDGHDSFFAGAISAVPLSLLIDGGTGNDRLTAGDLADVVIGGKGQDTLEGRGGADILDAFDGEVDTVACGAGSDTVYADPSDDVAGDCETRIAAAAPVHGPPTATVPPPPAVGGTPAMPPTAAPPAIAPPAPTLALSARSLPYALARGLLVRVAGVHPGARVRLSAWRGAAMLASGSTRATEAGTAAVRLRFTRSARHSLKRASRVRLTVSGLGAELAVGLRR